MTINSYTDTPPDTYYSEIKKKNFRKTNKKTSITISEIIYNPYITGMT